MQSACTCRPGAAVPTQRRAVGTARQRRLRPVAAAQAETATQPLTKDDLVAYLASGCKPREEWRWAAAGGRRQQRQR